MTSQQARLEGRTMSDASGVILVLLCAWTINAGAMRLFNAEVEDSRYPTLDGLRGYLALGVFAHHAALWWGHLKTGRWQSVSSVGHLGEVAVSLFFMITAFLFIGKLLDARASGRTVDWQQFFSGRVRRIVPMYAVTMGLLLILVGVKTQWTLHVDLGTLARSLLSWFTFTFAGRVDINGLAETSLVTAGVTWSLTFEWMFYLMLPLAALSLGLKTSRWAVGIALCAPLLLLIWSPWLQHAKPFLGGAAAACLVRLPVFRRWASTPWASVLVVIFLIRALFHPSGGFSDRAIIYTAAAFCLIAGGTSLFGLLTQRTSRFLGQPTYSLYLLHGLALYACFGFLSVDTAAHMTATGFWAAICALGMLLVLLCHCTYRRIELPSMGRAAARTAPQAEAEAKADASPTTIAPA
ncbi:acyltransferase family protein [Roseateles depolymerans]|uniref:acyltransferase family protein n=1 Tax=Roseateles depolymerans TaxID=76731 RepID=UPI001E499B10|nr:acyltransferase [Roseateles depolymerans]